MRMDSSYWRNFKILYESLQNIESKCGCESILVISHPHTHPTPLTDVWNSTRQILGMLISVIFFNLCDQPLVIRSVIVGNHGCTSNLEFC